MRAGEISKKLANRVHEFAPQLLPNGKRAGNYWQAGNALGESGTSLYLHLSGNKPGKWRDAATGEHGDMLDLISKQNGESLRTAIPIAIRMLGESHAGTPKSNRDDIDTRKSALGLWGCSQPLMTPYGAHGQAYFKQRGIILREHPDLRFHHAAWIHNDEGQRIGLPAIIAAVRRDNQITAVHRTFLNPIQAIKASLDEPRRSLGNLIGAACWLKTDGNGLIIAEGIETALSVGMAFGNAALAAGLNTYHITVMEIPEQYNRIMIAADNDTAGRQAAEKLIIKFKDRKIKAVYPRLNDWNDDLKAYGLNKMKEDIIKQIKP